MTGTISLAESPRGSLTPDESRDAGCEGKTQFESGPAVLPPVDKVAPHQSSELTGHRQSQTDRVRPHDFGVGPVIGIEDSVLVDAEHTLPVVQHGELARGRH